MFKITMIVYFYLAAGLVAGDWQPQDYSQYQLRNPPQPGSQYDQRVAQPAVYIGQQAPANLPQVAPCRRRNPVHSGIILTDSGWVPIPIGEQIPQSRVQSPPPQLKSQSLTQTKPPIVDERTQESEPTSQKSEYPDNIVEFVERNSLPSQESRRQNSDDDKRASLDQDRNDEPQMNAKSGNSEAYREESREETHDCGRNADVNDDSISDNSDVRDAASKSAPNDVRDEAVKLVSKCLHENRRAMDDSAESARNYEPSSLTSSAELDKTASNAANEDQDNNRKANFEVYLQNPAKNAGKLGGMKQVSLLENSKVCYACSTYYDPSCWTINTTTTVKYCNRDNGACLTKTYKINGKKILIRDCGHTCNEENAYDIGQKMTSCSMCHTDLCNAAFTIHGLNALLFMLVVSALTFTLQ